MSNQLVGYNVVLAARQFNPSVFNQLWLVRNNLLAEDDLEPGWVFTEPLIQVKTSQFALLVVPDQLQFVPLTQGESEEPLIKEKIGQIVSKLPHTPYTAIGFNFVWHMIPEDTGVAALSRRLFFKETGGFFKQFDADDSQFGGYASKNMFGFRQKVDVKPVSVQDEPRERLQFAFNYHKELIESVDPIVDIQELLGHWNHAKTASLQILESI
jgi:hypothetical protein